MESLLQIKWPAFYFSTGVAMIVPWLSKICSTVRLKIPMGDPERLMLLGKPASENLLSKG